VVGVIITPAVDPEVVTLPSLVTTPVLPSFNVCPEVTAVLTVKSAPQRGEVVDRVAANIAPCMVFIQNILIIFVVIVINIFLIISLLCYKKISTRLALKRLTKK
jgi:hypothetical protein